MRNLVFCACLALVGCGGDDERLPAADGDGGATTTDAVTAADGPIAAADGMAADVMAMPDAPPATVLIEVEMMDGTARAHLYHADVGRGAEHYGDTPYYQVLLMTEVCVWGMDIAAQSVITNEQTGEETLGGWFSCNAGEPPLTFLSVTFNGIPVTGTVTPRESACGGTGSNLFFSTAQFGCE